MAIDPSIALQAGGADVAAVNPLDTFGKFAGIRNALDTNEAIKAHVIQTKQQTAQSANDAFQQGFGEFLALPPQLQTQGVARQLVDSYFSRGIIGPAQHHDAMRAIDTTPDHPGLINMAQRALLRSAPPDSRIAQLYGSSAMPNTGGELVPGTVTTPMGRSIAGNNGAPPPPGFVPTGGNLTGTLSPGEQNAPHVLPTPGGAPEVVTGAGIARRGGQSGLIPGTGRIVPPPGLANPNRAPAPGTIATGMTPAQVAAQTTTGGTSAKAFQDISDQAVAARAQDAILANMQADAAQFTTGTGADKIKAFQNGVIRVMGPTGARAFGIDPERLAANESFDKLANQIANAQGAGSDARLAVNQAANPSSHTSPAGVDMILRQLRGNSDYLKARATLAATHPDQADARGFEAKVGKNLDPRVFQYQRLMPEQRGPYVKSLTDQKDFVRAYNWAEQNRLVGGP